MKCGETQKRRGPPEQMSSLAPEEVHPTKSSCTRERTSRVSVAGRVCLGGCICREGPCAVSRGTKPNCEPVLLFRTDFNLPQVLARVGRRRCEIFTTGGVGLSYSSQPSRVEKGWELIEACSNYGDTTVVMGRTCAVPTWGAPMWISSLLLCWGNNSV